MPRAYPVHMLLVGRGVLVVGGGKVAQRRVARLLEAEAQLHLVAPEATPKLQAQAQQGALRWSARAFDPTDCKGARLVFAATDDPAVNAQVEAAARRAGALVNRADAPDRCDFLVPAQARSEVCTASLSTEGRAPSAARRLSRELDRWLRGNADRFVAAVEAARSEWGASAEGVARLRALADGPLFEACRTGDETAIQRLLATAPSSGDGRG